MASQTVHAGDGGWEKSKRWGRKLGGEDMGDVGMRAGMRGAAVAGVLLERWGWEWGLDSEKQRER